MKKLILLFFLIGLVLTFSSCSSAAPYEEPEEGEPRAYLTIKNECNFTIYIYIDDLDAGYIISERSEQYEVSPGTRYIECYGTDDDMISDGEYPVYFSTYHTFSDDEILVLPIKFGIR